MTKSNNADTLETESLKAISVKHYCIPLIFRVFSLRHAVCFLFGDI